MPSYAKILARKVLKPADVSFKSKTGRSLKEYILQNPAKTAKQIADELGMDIKAVQKARSYYRRQGADLPKNQKWSEGAEYKTGKNNA